jgi:hypothetical protein
VEVLTFTRAVVDLPGFFIERGAGEDVGLGEGDALGEGDSLGMVPEGDIVSVGAGVAPPPVPGVVKSCALGADRPPGAEGMTPPGVEGMTPLGVEGMTPPGVEGMTPPGVEGMTPPGVVGALGRAETAKGRATPAAQHKTRINFGGTIAHFSSKKRKYKSAIGVIQMFI